METSAHTHLQVGKQKAECYYNGAILPRVGFPPQLTEGRNCHRKCKSYQVDNHD